MTMNIELVPAAREASAVLGNLFAPGSLDNYWEDSWRHPLLARVDGRYAGFALVHQRSRITAAPTTCGPVQKFDNSTP